MRAGRLTERVLIERATEGSQNSTGEPAVTWASLGTFPCGHPMPLSGSEQQRYQQTVAEELVKIEMRLQPDITFRRKDRATVNSRSFDILNIQETVRREQLFLICRDLPS